MKSPLDPHTPDGQTPRRHFLKVIPAAVAGSLAAPAIARQEQPLRISKETLDCGEKIFGVGFSEHQSSTASSR